jgi:DNA modification methylase
MTQTVPRKDIIIPVNRQRKEFDPEFIAELCEGIGKQGLLHAPVFRLHDGKHTLVAGETRIKAIEMLWMTGGTLRYNNQIIPEGHLPYVTLGELSPLEAKEAELEENLKRKPLTWQEQSAALQSLHTLRVEQAQAEGRIHTVADTALEVKGRSDGAYQNNIRKELVVAAHLSNPEVAKAKTAEEAFKILKKQEATAQNLQLAESIGKIYSTSVHTLLNVNCITWMKEQPHEQFDCILTDPPYGMGAQDFGDGGGKLVNSEHHYDDSIEAWRELMLQWCPLAYALAKKQCHAYVFCDQANFPELKKMMEDAGWYVFRTMLIAHKPNSGRVPLPTMGPRRQYETILYAIKGQKPVNAIVSDVISTNADANLTHGAQKPVALYVDLLKRSTRPGDSVADFFGGSGTMLAAATELKLTATVTEQSPEYYAMAYKRLKDLENAPAPLDGSALGSELMTMLTGKG